LGGFIGEDEGLNKWLGEKTKFWREAVTDLTSVMQAFPQAAYSGLQKWQFVQRVRKGIGPDFASAEQTLAKTFLPTLLATSTTKMTVVVLSLVSPSSRLDLPSQTPLPWHSQTMRRASSYAPTFWLGSEAWISSNELTNLRSSGTLMPGSNFAMLRKASPASTT
jgi:hypothetical protein